MVGGLVGHQHRVANYREGVGPQMGVFQVGLGDELGIVDVGYVPLVMSLGAATWAM